MNREGMVRGCVYEDGDLMLLVLRKYRPIILMGDGVGLVIVEDVKILLASRGSCENVGSFVIL